MDGSLGHHKANEARRNERVRKHNQHVGKEGVFEKNHKLIFNFPTPNEEELNRIKQNIKVKTAARQKRKTQLLAAILILLFSLLLLLIFI